jgi:two-component system, sensor histidine kinase YesM
MRRARRLFSFSLFAKMFSLSLALSFVLFTSLMLYAVLGARAALVRQNRDTSLHILNGIDNSITSYFQDIKNVLLMITGFEDLQASQAGSVRQMLAAFASANQATIGGLYLVRPDGSVIADRQVVFDIVGNKALAEVYARSAANPDVVTHSEPYYSPMQTGMTVAFMRGIRERGTRRTSVCVVEANTAHITATLLPEVGSRYFTFVLLTDSAVVAWDGASPLLPYATPSYPALRNEIDDPTRRSLVSLPLGESQVRLADRSIIALRKKLGAPDFYGVLLFDAEAFRASIVRLIRSFLIIGAIFTVLLVGANLLLARHFTRPIHALAERMDGIALSAKVPALEINREDEIGTLYERFHYMLGRIHDLLARQRRTEAKKRAIELQLLRAQLKPHFLCNTLACIGSLSRRGKHGEAQEMIRSLIILLVSSFEGDEELVPLASELELIDAYVAIQKVRFGASFEYRRPESPGGQSPMVPKMLLLPLVENAIVHGMSGRRGGGRIEVSCDNGPDELTIVVADNGKGIPSDRLRRIVSPGGGPAARRPPSRNGGHTIGIRNVQERIRLHYGRGCGLTITSKAGKGTRVAIRLLLDGGGRRRAPRPTG